jgi:Protein of unknown function (DUF433)
MLGNMAPLQGIFDMDWSDCPLVEVVPGKVSGVPILKGTRMQADSVLENYVGGSSAEEIAENFGYPKRPSAPCSQSRIVKGVPDTTSIFLALHFLLEESGVDRALIYGRRMVEKHAVNRRLLSHGTHDARSTGSAIAEYSGCEFRFSAS